MMVKSELNWAGPWHIYYGTLIEIKFALDADWAFQQFVPC